MEVRRDKSGKEEEEADEGGNVESWALKLLLSEVKRAVPVMDPMRADVLLSKIEARQKQKLDRGRAWVTRAARTLVIWAAAVAGSRAFRMLTL